MDNLVRLLRNERLDNFGNIVPEAVDSLPDTEDVMEILKEYGAGLISKDDNGIILEYFFSTLYPKGVRSGCFVGRDFSIVFFPRFREIDYQFQEVVAEKVLGRDPYSLYVGDREDRIRERILGDGTHAMLRELFLFRENPYKCPKVYMRHHKYLLSL